VWQKNVDGSVNLFTEDGSVSTDDPTLPRVQGREGLRNMISGGLDTAKPRPFVQNHVIERLGPNRAKGTCSVEVRLLRDGQEWWMTGWCDDEYAKVDEEWKFQSRKITTDSFVPLHGSAAHAEGAVVSGTGFSDAQPFAERFDPFHEPYLADPYPFFASDPPRGM
jgi:SnoaL-like domain